MVPRMAPRHPVSSKSTPTFRDVVMACMSPKVALPNLKAMDPQPSRHTMLRALLWFRNERHPRQSEVLARYLEKEHPTVPPKPSRVKPRPGDVRRYSVQRQKNGLFARVPIELLGIKKGDDVVVEFFPAIMPGVLIVRPLGAEERRTLKKMTHDKPEDEATP